jgi:hypothetical protein
MLIQSRLGSAEPVAHDFDILFCFAERVTIGFETLKSVAKRVKSEDDPRRAITPQGLK